MLTTTEAITTVPLAQRLLERSFDRRGQQLDVSGLAIQELAVRYGTPLFLYDLDVAQRQWRRLRKALPEPVDIYYSVKANPHPIVVQHFRQLGAGCEVASAAELQLALRAGCPKERIVFAGPGKTDEELRLAIEVGIGGLHAESIRELSRINALAERLGARAPVAIRVNPLGDVQGGAMRMGGKASPFGLDEEQLDDAIDLVLQSRALEWSGLHFYNGTQILDAAVLERQYRHAVEVAKRVAERTNCPIRTLDFGGGLGVPYLDHESDLDLGELAARVGKSIEHARRHEGLALTRFIVEPGRFLIAEAGIYVTRVLDVKPSRGKKFVVVDGGMHHHLAASGNLGQTIKRNYPIAVLTRLGEPASEVVDIVGCLCTPLDTLARGIELPRIEPGDLIGIFQSGAYALTASPQAFLSHAKPAELCLSQGRVLNS